MKPIKEIIRMAGGVVSVARAAGISHASVCQWPHVPIKHVQVVCKLSGLTPEQVRPDVYCWIKHPHPKEKEMRA